MKVLQIINSLVRGGAEQLTLDLHEGYLSRGIDSYAVGLESAASKLPQTYTLGLDRCYQLSVLFKLFLFLRQPRWRDLDVIHVHLFPAQLLVPLIVRVLGIKAVLVTTEHNTSNRRIDTLFGRIIDPLFYNSYQQIVCNSQGTLQMMSRWQPQMVDRMSTIYNGINLDKYQHPLLPAKERDLTIVVSIGRLVAQKNYLPAIRAMSQVKYQNFEYWIVGAGSLEPELRDLVSTLNLEHKIKFLGFCTDIPAVLAQADIFLQTSLWEGFGLAVVEAMAAGLPVVVSDVPGVREVVIGCAGCVLLSDPSSVAEIANKLDTLFIDRKLRKTMGATARARAADFDIDRTIAAHICLYDALSKK